MTEAEAIEELLRVLEELEVSTKTDRMDVLRVLRRRRT